NSTNSLPAPQQTIPIVPPDPNSTPAIQVNLNTTGTPGTPGTTTNTSSNPGASQNFGPPPGPGLDRTPEEQQISGIPATNETRFASNEVVVQISDTVPTERVLEIASGLGMVLISSQHIELTHRVLYRFRATGKDVRLLIAALEKNYVVASAQPNYFFRFGQ